MRLHPTSVLAATCAACVATGCSAPTDALLDGTGCGGCEVVAPAQNAPAAIVADGSGAYWIDRGVATGTSNDSYVGGTIVTASSTGQVSVLVQQVEARMLAVSAAGVFFDEQDPAASGASSLMRLGKDGSLVYITPSLSGLALLAADDDSVYWVSGATEASSQSKATLYRAAPDGTNVVTLATLMAPTALSVDDSGIYVVEGSSLVGMAKDGTGARTLVELSSLQGTARIAVDATSVYWTTAASSSAATNAIVATEKQGGGVRVVANGLPGAVAGLAVDAGTLYFSTVATKTSSDYETAYYGQIESLSPADATPRLLASYALPAGSYSGWVSDLAAAGSRVYATTVVAVAPSDPKGVGDVVSVPE